MHCLGDMRYGERVREFHSPYTVRAEGRKAEGGEEGGKACREDRPPLRPSPSWCPWWSLSYSNETETYVSSCHHSSFPPTPTQHNASLSCCRLHYYTFLCFAVFVTLSNTGILNVNIIIFTFYIMNIQIQIIKYDFYSQILFYCIEISLHFTCRFRVGPWNLTCKN